MIKGILWGLCRSKKEPILSETDCIRKQRLGTLQLNPCYRNAQTLCDGIEERFTTLNSMSALFSLPLLCCLKVRPVRPAVLLWPETNRHSQTL